MNDTPNFEQLSERGLNRGRPRSFVVNRGSVLVRFDQSTWD